MHKKQQDRKLRKNPFVPQLFERFFRRNEGTTDYATIPSVTLSGDFSGSVEFSTTTTAYACIVSGPIKNISSIVVDVSDLGFVRFFAYNSSGTLQGIAQSIASVNDGFLHTANFSLSGTVASLSIDGGTASTAIWGSFDTASLGHLYRRPDGDNLLAGILANLHIYDNGVLVRDYPLDDNSADLREKVSGQNGTLINSTPDQWGLFQQQRTLEWLGPELITQAVWETPANAANQWSFSNDQWALVGDGSFNQLQLLTGPDTPAFFRIKGSCVSISGTLAAEGSGGGFDIVTTGAYSFDMDKSIVLSQQFKRRSGIVNATLSKPTI